MELPVQADRVGDGGGSPNKTEPTTPNADRNNTLATSTLRGEHLTNEMDEVISEVGPYRVGERIGKGAFGTVYKALDTESGDFVAIKRIRVDHIKNKQLMKLLAEGHLMEQLQHDNIVRFLGALETEKHIHLVLEYVDSGSLASLVAKYGKLSEKLMGVYLKQVLQGLAYLHSHGVVHRDIKGHNLLISNAGAVKVADFGIAHLYDGTRRKASASASELDVGSPYWMAPEVVQMCEASPASDVWSIGCTAIELLTGRPPYYELSKTAACFRMVEDEHPPFPDTCSAELKAFLERCFRKDPAQRATAEELLSHPWIVEQNAKKAPMKRHTSITTLPRFQVNAADGKRAAQKAALVQKSISVTTLPRYAVNPTIAPSTGFQSLRGAPPGLTEEIDGPEPLTTSPKSASRRGSKIVSKTCTKCDSKFGFLGRFVCDHCKNSFCKNCISKKMSVPKVGKCRFCGDCIVHVATGSSTEKSPADGPEKEGGSLREKGGSLRGDKMKGSSGTRTKTSVEDTADGKGTIRFNAHNNNNP